MYVFTILGGAIAAISLLLCLDRLRYRPETGNATVGRLDAQHFFAVLLGSFSITWGAQGWLDSMYGAYRARTQCGDEGDAAYAALFLCAAYGGLSGLIFVLYSVFSRVKFIQLAVTGSGNDDGDKTD